ncbi:MAG: DUF3857 domain-containing protein [Alistipes sp.]|nr:DUF3857 domain-containing protein [Alistipes sp.]
MKHILLLIALAVMAFAAEAQESFKLGNISVDDFTQTSYAVDTTAADAVILDELQQSCLMIFDYRNRKYSERGNALISQSTISRKIKILNPQGVRYATVSLDYYCDKAATPRHTSAYVGDITAFSYSLKDGVVEKHALRDEDIDVRWLNDSTVRVEFTVPNVSAGSIIEYSYNTGKESVRPYMVDFAMQHEIPVVSSRCEIAVSSEQQPGMMREDWYGLLMAGKSKIKSTKNKGRVQLEATSKVSRPVRHSFDGGYSTTGHWSGTRIYADCIFHNFHGKNLPAVTAATPASEVAAISVILQDNK